MRITALLPETSINHGGPSGTPARLGVCVGSFVALGGSREDAWEMRERYQHRQVVFCFGQALSLVCSIMGTKTFGSLAHGFDHLRCQLNLRLQAGEGCDLAVIGIRLAQRHGLVLQAFKLLQCLG